MDREAMLYHAAPERGEGVLVCDLCHHRCRILSGKTGFCGARRNEAGRLVSLVYGRCAALTPDPIEKKPLFHFLPGTTSMSVATVGCNFTCDFCQNHHLSQYLRDVSAEAPGDRVEPGEIVRAASRHGCRSLSFTYSEPTIFLEYALETARLARAEGVPSCFVSNGFMTPEAVDALGDNLAAINVDLKSFNPEVYRKIIGGALEGVLETLRYLRQRGVWLEVTTLLIEGVNDSPEEVEKIARFIADLSVDVPWHVSRFHPQYRMPDAPPTSTAAVLSALKIGRDAGLRHIYCGNMRDDRSESTWCHKCGALLIARKGYSIEENRLGLDGICDSCGTACAGYWRVPEPPL